MQDELKKIKAQLASQQATLDKILGLLEGQSKKRRTAKPESIIKYIKNAHLYKDEKFAYFLAKGIMPRRKLLKLTRLSTSELDPVLDAMIAARRIFSAPCVDEKGNKGEIGYSVM